MPPTRSARGPQPFSIKTPRPDFSTPLATTDDLRLSTPPPTPDGPRRRLARFRTNNQSGNRLGAKTQNRKHLGIPIVLRDSERFRRQNELKARHDPAAEARRERRAGGPCPIDAHLHSGIHSSRPTLLITRAIRTAIRTAAARTRTHTTGSQRALRGESSRTRAHTHRGPASDMLWNGRFTWWKFGPLSCGVNPSERRHEH